METSLAAAVTGDPQVVLVEGEAGIGKSSLLRAFRADHPETTTLAWLGDDLESHLPFAMLDQLLAGEGGWADPFTAGAALLARLGELAGVGPVVIVLDDVHLADRPSLAALSFALRRLRHDPVLALLTARAGQVRELPSAIVQMATDGDRRLALHGLDVAEVRALAQTMGVGQISEGAAGRLHAMTQGNPLHLRALLAEVPAEDLVRLDRPLPAPASFAQLVLAELGAASPEAERVATAAATLGDRCEISELIAVSGLDRDGVLQALDDLERLRMMRVRPGSSTAAFTHPLVRAAVYDDLGPARRSALHLAAAAALDGWPALRHRIAAAHGLDPDLAADLEAWSCRERAGGSAQAAADAMLASHRHTPAGRDADRRLLAVVDMYAAAGDAHAAQAFAAEVDALPVSGLRLAVQARTAWLAGHPDAAVDLGQQAWDRSDLDPSERDLIAEMLARIELLRDHPEEAVTWANRALEDGRLGAEHASHTRSQRVLGLATAGRYDEAWAELADLPDDPEDVAVARHAELGMRGLLVMFEGPHHQAVRDLAVASALTHGDMQPFRLECAAAMAQALFHAGEWDRSQAILEQIAALAQDVDQVWLDGFLHADRAKVPAARGDWAVADEHLAAARAFSRSAGELASVAYADEAAVLLATARGDAEAVIRATDRIRRARERSPQRELGIFCWPAYLISALIELGELDQAQAELALLRSRASSRGQRTEAVRLRAAGQLAVARRDTRVARECFTRALAVAEDRVDALERALAHDAYGRFLRRRGERRSAVDQLRQATSRYRSLGAAPFAERCDQELAACGVHDPGSPVAADLLTPQERAVASLISAGRTNREAAEALVVSVKTVGFHLSNVYAKLGVHSRAQLVTAIGSTTPTRDR